MVRDWPDREADWRVKTTSQDGRQLSVVGWHSFSPEVPVGRMNLHVSQRRALLIVGYALVDTLVSGDRADALGALVACAAAIAQRLKADLNIGNGCLEWQLEPGRMAAIQQAFPNFKPTRKRNPLKRGKRYLRLDP